MGQVPRRFDRQHSCSGGYQWPAGSAWPATGEALQLPSRLKSGSILLADCGYDADWIRAFAARKGALANTWRRQWLRTSRRKNRRIINARVRCQSLPLPRDISAKCGGRHHEKRFKIVLMRTALNPRSAEVWRQTVRRERISGLTGLNAVRRFVRERPLVIGDFSATNLGGESWSQNDWRSERSATSNHLRFVDNRTENGQGSGIECRPGFGPGGPFGAKVPLPGHAAG